ncbi:DUF3857 domain-containing protein [Inquilinus sp. KBS0705]|nr:DUF3857 domain-containing protein [Inquilinus sp. KBS0705]
MNKAILLFLVLTFSTTSLFAQDFPYGTWSQEEINLKKYAPDTSAHAFVINDHGLSQFNIMSDGYTRITFEAHIKIKILDEKAFNKGTVEIPFHEEGNSSETVTEIKGITTYLDDNGNVKTAELDPHNVFFVKNNNYWSTAKFTMPNMRKGCIIEYRYKLTTPYWERLPNWYFQSDIPSKYSEYEVHIPAFWNYNASIRGELQLTKNTTEVEKECYINGSAKADCSLIVFGMSNIPAFTEEDYMGSPKTYLSGIYFQLSDWTNPFTGAKSKYTKEWKDVDYSFKRSDYFGAQLRKKDIFKASIAPLIAGKTNDLDKAKAVYSYIQKSMRYDNVRSINSESIRKAFDKHSGNVGDINLALVNALNYAGINTEAVLLSTLGNGIINRVYPVTEDFDYVIAKATIGSDTYLLDATDPLLPFGMLPLNCFNDQGRVMSLDKPSEWIDITPKYKKSVTTTLDLTMESTGKLKGTITTYSYGYEGLEKRKAIKKFNTTDEYIEDFDEKLIKTHILKSEIINLDSLDKPLAEKYEVEIDLYDKLNNNMAFNPIILNRLINNPFKLATRTFPVIMGVPSETRYILTMHLPANYSVTNAPQTVAINLPNRGGQYLNDFKKEGDVFYYSKVMQLNNAVYMPEEYPYLKEFYNKAIAAEKSEIVIRKK